MYVGVLLAVILIVSIGGLDWHYVDGTNTMEDNVSPHATVTKGVFLYQRKDVILFNDYHPFNVVVDLPKYDVPEKGKDCVGNALLCNGYKHVFKVQKTLETEVFKSNPYLTGILNETEVPHRDKRGLINAVGYINKFLFGIATSDDVDTLHGDIGRMAIKMNEMVTSSQKYMFDVGQNISAYSVNLTRLVASGLTKFEQFRTQQNTGDAMFMEIINLLVVNFHLESVSQMMHTTASDCRNELIPRGVITDKLMQDKLLSLQSQLQKHDYVVSVSLNQLLKLKVAHCVFAKEKLEVTIKIPVRRAKLSLKLYQLLHTPFHFNNQQCRLDTDVSFIVQVNNDMIPVTTDMQPYCNPNTEKLCMVAENSYFTSTFSSCAEALIGTSQKDIVSNCVLKCGPVMGIWITQLSSTEFAITNSINITVVCAQVKKKSYIMEEVGAVLLELGCGCNAIVRDDYKQRNLVVTPSYPCLSTTLEDYHSVTTILPTQMSNLKNAIFEENSENYLNVSEIVNEDWRAELPTLTIDQPKPVQFSTDYIANELTSSFSYSTSIIYIWLALLTVGIIALGVMIMLSNGRASPNGFGMIPYLMIFSPTFGLCLDPRAQKTVTFNDSIWALVQALEIMNVICWAIVMVFVLLVLLFMHKSMKNVRICNRLLNAYEDGSFF